MATIKDTYVLEDKVSSVLDSIISKMTGANGAAAKMYAGTKNGASQMAASAADMVSSAGEVSGAVENMASASSDSSDRMTRDFSGVSAATQNLVDRLSSAERAIAGAFTDSEADAALAKLQAQMQTLGLVWTNTADQMEASDLIVRMGLQQLADQGSLAASVLAEEAYAAQDAAEAQENHGNILQKMVSGLKSVATAGASAVKSLLGFNSVKNPLESITSKISRMALSFLSIRKIVSYISDAMESATDDVAESFTALKDTVSTAFSRTVVSAMKAMQSGIEKINAAFESDAGQKFLRGLEAAATLAGTAIGYFAEILSSVIQWIGDNFQTVMTIAIVLIGLFAAKMLVAAAASIAANATLYLMIAAVTLVITILQSLGVSSEEILTGIGSLVGWLYAFVYNIIADVWNVIAVFVEFFANVFNNPLAAVAHLFFDTFDAILGIVETVAGAIDALLGSNMSGAISSFRDSMQAWVNETFGENAITVTRMDKISYTDSMAKGAEIGASVANAFSDTTLSTASATELKLADISADTSSISGSAASIAKDVDMAEEDLQSLVDMAERQYVNQINLTSQTPVINVNGANTGNTAADRQAIADAIQEILVAQIASGSTRTTSRTF